MRLLSISYSIKDSFNIRIQDQKHTQPNTQLLESKFADIQNSSYPINNKSPIFYSTSSSSSSSSLSSSSSSNSFPHPPHFLFPSLVFFLPRARPSHPRRISVGNFTPEHASSRQHDPAIRNIASSLVISFF